MTRKLLGGIGLCAVLTLAFNAGCTITVEPGIGTASGDFNGSLSFDGITALTIDWRNGSIELRVSDTATEIGISGTQRVTADSDEAAQAALDDWTIEVANAAGDAATAVLNFGAPSSSTRVYRADVEVVIPAGVALTVDNENGTIDITGNTGTTTIRVTNGSVNVIDQAGNTDITTTNGSVELRATDGNIDVQSSNGSITIDSTSGNVEAQTENGSIDIDARPEDNGTISATVQLGSIEIRVPADFAADVDFEGGFGGIFTDLSEFTVTGLEETLNDLTATLNGGGGLIEADTSVGSISFESLP